MTTNGLPVIDGWQLHDGDYAEPVARGGGYVEIQDNGDLKVAVELDSDEAEMLGCGRLPATTIPAAVWRELVKRFDAGPL